MSQIIDNIFSEVCLDSRIPDGIFKLDENDHMSALRDHLIKAGGLTTEDAVSITNRMVEGKFPERQAYRKEDGILVTWPSPKHKADSMRENPGKYTDQNPSPKPEVPDEPEPKADKTSLDRPTSGKPPAPVMPEPSTVKQDNLELTIEPSHGEDKPFTPPTPPTPPISFPKTDAEREAEKAVVSQIIQGGDTIIPHNDPTLGGFRESALNIVKLLPEVWEVWE